MKKSNWSNYEKMKDLEAIFGKIVHSSGSIEYFCWLILRPQNGWNKVV